MFSRQRALTGAAQVILFAFTGCLLPAQTTTTLVGVVTSDTTGATVPDGQATAATNTGTNLTRTTKTNAAGEYRLDFLPTGTYRVEINANGFKKFQRDGIVLQATVPATVDARLEVGGVNESVTVTSDAPLVNTNNRRSAARSTTPRSRACRSWAATCIRC